MTSNVDDHFACPSGCYVNSSLSVLGSEFAPPVSECANDPGLNSESIFDPTKRGFTMRGHHWLMIVIGLLVAFFALRYFGVIA
jgi:hypothetical protein